MTSILAKRLTIVHGFRQEMENFVFGKEPYYINYYKSTSQGEQTGTNFSFTHLPVRIRSKRSIKNDLNFG